AGGLAGSLVALERAGRPCSWKSDRRPHAPGDGGPDRLFPQHAGDAHGPVWRPDVCGTAGAGEERGPGGLYASGSAVRETGGGGTARAGPFARGISPGDVHTAEHAAVFLWVAGADLEAGAIDPHDLEVRPDG